MSAMIATARPAAVAISASEMPAATTSKPPERVDRRLRERARRVVEAAEAPESLEEDAERDHRAREQRIGGQPALLEQLEDASGVQGDDSPARDAGGIRRALTPRISLCLS